MFGANDNTQISNDDPAMLDNVKELASDPATSVTPAQPQFMTTSVTTPTTTSSVQQNSNSFTAPSNTTSPPNSDSVTAYGPHAEPAQGFSSSPMPEPVASPTIDPPAQDESTEIDLDTPIAAAMAPVDPDQLAGMKQQALEHLEPLVGHLDQTPEEAFKTTMMMIQANDNHTLLEKALEEAKKIEDDKARANAMLDIINEINYFSQVSQQ